MYKVPPEILEKYAKVMVLYALNGGEGIKPGETVWLMGNECSADLFKAIRKEIYLAGGNVIERFIPDDTDRYGLNLDIIKYGSDEQLKFFPEKYWQGIIDSADHLMFILAQPNVHLMKGLPTDKISLKSESAEGPIMQMRAAKEKMSKLFWTLCLYGTESAANEAGMTLQEYWEQIINACYLREDDPVSKWKSLQQEMTVVAEKLSSLQIEEIQMMGADMNLTVKIGEGRKFISASGHNVPSFEVYTSPDWRGTKGWINFNQPLYYQGVKISGIKLAFHNGIVTEFYADENQEALKAMLSKPNSNKLGEVSLTDRRHSRITMFMAHTLFDENMGGEYGNTHVAVGKAYKSTYNGDSSAFQPEDWERLGFNDCPPVHVDMVSTTNRTVMATLKGGKVVCIYKDGEFQLDNF